MKEYFEIKITLDVIQKGTGLYHRIEPLPIKPHIGYYGVYFATGQWQNCCLSEIIKCMNVIKDYYKLNPKKEPHRLGYDENDIDDHTSVWGGAGPDCSIGQREAA
jgi:hypothetical protein